ncbi:hypothetical protein Pmani_025358 [Petrolisthes manimaculis]|uniref:Uncharacterized protein n=1 Tax=Petrolisthes manimaculis TaxID=1843537 RepID=A0AAE1TZ06_9EUCA|nr:hypothetical protein Pmani_025358 [Petrolisthes manimaculis]
MDSNGNSLVVYYLLGWGGVRTEGGDPNGREGEAEAATPRPPLPLPCPYCCPCAPPLHDVSGGGGGGGGGEGQEVEGGGRSNTTTHERLDQQDNKQQVVEGNADLKNSKRIPVVGGGYERLETSDPPCRTDVKGVRGPGTPDAGRQQLEQLERLINSFEAHQRAASCDLSDFTPRHVTSPHALL